MKKRPNKPANAVQYKHDLGQHFLYDTELLRNLVQKIDLRPTDRVLEIGAGAGTLTRVLCETASHVTAVEVDQALIPHLRILAYEFPNLEIIQGDIRKVDLQALHMGECYRVVANIPYNITSQILDLFWGKETPVQQISVMVQKEVADKLVAMPGEKAYGLTSVRCRYYTAPEIIACIPASAFTPPPKVDSAFVNMTFHKQKLLSPEEEQLMWKLVNASYRLRRKTLMNALKPVINVSGDRLTEVLSQLGFPATVRGEVLSVAQWIALTQAIRG